MAFWLIDAMQMPTDPTPNFNLRRRPGYPYPMSAVPPMPPVWPDSSAFWQDKRVIVIGGSGCLGSFVRSAFEISIKELPEPMPRLTGFAGRMA